MIVLFEEAGVDRPVKSMMRIVIQDTSPIGQLLRDPTVLRVEITTKDGDQKLYERVDQ